MSKVAPTQNCVGSVKLRPVKSIRLFIFLTERINAVGVNPLTGLSVPHPELLKLSPFTTTKFLRPIMCAPSNVVCNAVLFISLVTIVNKAGVLMLLSIHCAMEGELALTVLPGLAATKNMSGVTEERSLRVSVFPLLGGDTSQTTKGLRLFLATNSTNVDIKSDYQTALNPEFILFMQPTGSNPIENRFDLNITYCT